jgi:cytochrome c oxidase subunit 4
VLLAVFAALIAMTAITVAVTKVDLGSWNLVAALAIATVKASLVALYFMHLRYDHPFHALVFVSALAFLAIFIVLTLMDTVDAEPDVQQFRQATPAAVSWVAPPPRIGQPG